jgi:pimeloyl-ACP methyl ester carboxylesterase
MTASPGAIVEVNGAAIYHEIRGAGPPLLFISGSTGDAGHFDQVANALQNEFTVVTYDRRGNSRSPRPEGRDRTSVDEQADDAAGLIEALDGAPALVYGNSTGAIIALSLLIRHPALVRGAMLHEPPLLSVLSRPEEATGLIQPIIEREMAAGRPWRAAEAFLRLAMGDASFDRMDEELRKRVLGNGETLFGFEFGRFELYRPDDSALAAVGVPVQVIAGEDGIPFCREAADWLAARLNLKTVTMAGAHTPQSDRPQVVAEAIRSFSRRLGTG